ncbi:hypothetical protein [Sphingobium yanoikuyae]|nr:hypothetical protein [Sphingobium yanoikuyae]
MILHCYVDDQTLDRLIKQSVQTGRTVEDLAECAIAEAALCADREESR